MSDDLLERSLRAYAAVTEERGSDRQRLERTLLRIQRTRRPAPRLRRSLRVWWWSAAALFIGMGAWASGGAPVAWLRSVVEPPPAQVESAPPPKPSPRPLAPARRPLVDEPPALAPPASDDAAPPSDDAVPSEPASTPSEAIVHPRETSLRRAVAPAPIESADDAYRRAHRAHFDQRDYERALSAWDRYLELSSAGHQLLPEARFNRAIALYRLRRWRQARAALEPFANGEYGGYHRDEARQLLEALERSDPQRLRREPDIDGTR